MRGGAWRPFGPCREPGFVRLALWTFPVLLSLSPGVPSAEATSLAAHASPKLTVSMLAAGRQVTAAGSVGGTAIPQGEATPGWRVVLQQQSSASHRRWVTRASGPLTGEQSTAVFELSWAASRPRAARTIILRVGVLSGRRMIAQSGARRVTVRPLVSVNAVVRHGTVELPGRLVVSTTGDPSATQTVVLARGAPAPPVGGVLLADPSATAPEGVLGVVTGSHRLAGGATEFTTRPAALSEAFRTFSASLGGTLAELSSPRGTGARAADTATLTCDSHGAITHTFEVSLSDFDVAGQLEATVIAPFIELSVWAAPRVTIAVTASGSTHCVSHFKPITRQLRGPLFISLTPTVRLDADGSVTMTYTWRPFFLYQFSRGQHNDHDTREFFNHGTPTLSAQVHAKAQVELAVELSVAKRIGLGGSLGPHVDATATARFAPPPPQACLDATAAVHYGLYAFADVFVKHWTFDLATGDFLKRTIFDGCTPTGVGQEEPPKGGGEEHAGGGGGVGGGGGSTWSQTTLQAPAPYVYEWRDVSCSSQPTCALSGVVPGMAAFSELFAWSTSPLAGAPAWLVNQPNGGGGQPAVSVYCLPSGGCVAPQGDNGANPGGSYQTFDSSGTLTADNYSKAVNTFEAFACPTAQICLASARTGITEWGLAASSNAFPGPEQEPVWSIVATASSVRAPHSPVCPSTSFCAAVGWSQEGATPTIATSPGVTGPWKGTGITQLEGETPEAISCPSANFCAAVVGRYVLTSTEPSGVKPSWQVTELPASSQPTSISCPSAEACAIGDKNGDVLTSTHPTGGASAWAVTKLVAGGGFGASVSCPTTTLCVFVNAGPWVWTSSNPFGS
jgi:hypothetical protein